MVLLATVKDLYIPLLKEDLEAQTTLRWGKRGGCLFKCASTDADKEVSPESL